MSKRRNTGSETLTFLQEQNRVRNDNKPARGRSKKGGD